VGFARAQAKEVVQTMEEAMNDKFATKDDLIRETTLLRHEAQIFREEVKSEFKQVRAEAQVFREEVKNEFKLIRLEMKSMTNEIIIKLASIMTILMGFWTGVMTYLR
jgi:hypothetical protein